MLSTVAPPLPKMIAVAAMASNRVIGKEGKLPWHLPEDLKFFKHTTLGHPVLMGRRTFESIVARLGKPLPGRMNIVLSGTLPAREGVEVITKIEQLTRIAGLTSPVYLIGGAQLYEALLPQCAEVLLTLITQPYEGDALFPPFEEDFAFREVLARGDGFEIQRYTRK